MHICFCELIGKFYFDGLNPKLPKKTLSIFPHIWYVGPSSPINTYRKEICTLFSASKMVSVFILLLCRKTNMTMNAFDYKIYNFSYSYRIPLKRLN